LTADRTVTSNGNSLTILGGKETFAGTERALWLKTSTNAKSSVQLVLENTFTTTGKIYEIGSDSDGTFNIADRTASALRLKIGNFYFQFHSSSSANANLLGQVAGINALWFNQTATSATTANYTLCNASVITLLNAPTGGEIRFRVGNAERMMLTNAGRLLLGTTTESTFLLDVNGTARVSDNVLIQKNQNAVTAIEIKNTTSGTSSQSQIFLESDSNSGVSVLGKYSTTTTAYRIIGSKDLYLFNNQVGGDIAILNDVPTGKIKFGVSGTSTPQMTLTAAGRLLLGTVSEGTNILEVVGKAAISDTSSFGTNTFTNKLNASFGTIGIQSFSVNNAWFGDNVFFNGTNFVRIASGFSGLFYFAGSEGQFRWGSTGSAGSAVSNGSTGNGLISFKMNLDGTVAMGDLSNLAGNYTGANFIMFGSSKNIGINTTTDVASAKLHISSTTQGFLPPRMTTTQKNAISSPVAGLQVYDSTTNAPNYYNGTAWIELGAGGGGVTGSGTINNLPKWTGITALGNSILDDDGTSASVALASGGSFNIKYISAIKLALTGGTTFGAIDLPVGLDFVIRPDSVEKFKITSVGQLVLSSYTSPLSIPGTAAGLLAFDSSGNIITTSVTVASSGTYTPTVTAISGGATSVTSNVARYTRVGNVVTVYGFFFYQPSGSGAVETNNEFTITLPITRTVTTNAASGTVSFTTVSGVGEQSQGYLYGTATTTISLYAQNWWSGSGANAYYTFSYEIN
jgi:hypothetical protein